MHYADIVQNQMRLICEYNIYIEELKPKDNNEMQFANNRTDTETTVAYQSGELQGFTVKRKT